MSQPIVARKDAVAKRLIRYYTGKPCKNGHLAERYTKSCVCTICQKEDDEKRLKVRYKKKRPTGPIIGFPVMVISRVNIPQF